MSAVALISALLVACGGGQRQDSNEPTGDYPVQITKAEFPNRQRLAGTSDLTLEVRNSGDKDIPDLAVTISTDPEADESFSVRDEQPGLAIPSRSVWVLENGYPKLGGASAPAGAEAAQTKTFSFGALPAGESRLMIWRLTPTIAGTYTVNYKIAAGLEGKAKAVTSDGSIPEGEFVVKISDVPPQTRVDESGKVVPIKPTDIIGQAGSAQQRGEVGAGGGSGTSAKPGQ
ncbi:MAG: hypothetical protein ABR536_00065 [Solirubrobacterales bacterium]